MRAGGTNRDVQRHNSREGVPARTLRFRWDALEGFLTPAVATAFNCHHEATID